VTAQAKCLPTESPSKVAKAVLNIFPDSRVEQSEEGIVARSSSLERFKELIRNYRILDTTRSVLLAGRSGSTTSFSINKQVAFVGKISFVEERMPLGSIDVTFEDEDIESLIDGVAPVTVNGEEVLK